MFVLNVKKTSSYIFNGYGVFYILEQFSAGRKPYMCYIYSSPPKSRPSNHTPFPPHSHPQTTYKQSISPHSLNPYHYTPNPISHFWYTTPHTSFTPITTHLKYTLPPYQSLPLTHHNSTIFNIQYTKI